MYHTKSLHDFVMKSTSTTDRVDSHDSPNLEDRLSVPLPIPSAHPVLCVSSHPSHPVPFFPSVCLSSHQLPVPFKKLYKS